MIVPGKSLQEVSKILSGETDEEVRIFFTGNHIVFEFDNTWLFPCLIEGEYFKINQMLSSDYETKVKWINKKELLNCIDPRNPADSLRATRSPIIVQISDGEMRLKLTIRCGLHE